MKQLLNNQSLKFSDTKFGIIGVFFEESLKLFDLAVLVNEVLRDIFSLHWVHVIFFNDFCVL